MFFILMSVFIALIAESYEEAKNILAIENDELKKLAPELINDKTIRHAIRNRARDKFRFAVECNLLSVSILLSFLEFFNRTCRICP